MSYQKLFFLFVFALLAGCHTTGRQFHPAHTFKSAEYRTVQPWRGDRFQNDKKSFQFAIMADRNGGNRPGVFEQTVQKINYLQPEFVMSVGDYIKGGTEKDSLIRAQWADFFRAIAPLQMPFFCLPGNHDISNLTMRQAWIDRFGATYYHFIYGNVLFICLNTEDPPAGHISDEQVNYIKRTLAENNKVTWTMVFMHKPLWKYDDPAGYQKIEPLLRDRPHTVIAGHEHNYEKTVREGISHYVLATTGGSSKLRGTLFGEFDHIVWVTMTEQGPRLANLAVDGIYGDKIEKAVP